MEREPGRLHLAELGRNAKPKAVARTGTTQCLGPATTARTPHFDALEAVRLNATGSSRSAARPAALMAGDGTQRCGAYAPGSGDADRAQRAGAVGVSASKPRGGKRRRSSRYRATNDTRARPLSIEFTSVESASPLASTTGPSHPAPRAGVSDRRKGQRPATGSRR